MAKKFLDYTGLTIVWNKITTLFARKTEVSAVQTELTNFKATKGQPNGLATLDDTGKVLSSQLPSYVDDVLEYDNKSVFPGTGEAGKIYVSKNDNKTYRWSGSAYVEISASLALGETTSTAYPGNKGKQNADNIAAIQGQIGTENDGQGILSRLKNVEENKADIEQLGAVQRTLDNKLDMVFGSSKEEGIFFGWDYRGGGTSTGLEMYWKGVLNLAFRNGTTLFHNPDGIFNQRSSDQINEILDDSMAITSDEIDELINEVDNDDGTGTTTTQATLFLSGARVTRNELSKNSSSNTVTFNFEATFSDVSNLGTGIIRIPAGYIPSQTTSVTYNWTMSSTQKQYACDGEVTTNGILYVSTNNIPIPETYGASGKTTLSATWQTA